MKVGLKLRKRLGKVFIFIGIFLLIYYLVAKAHGVTFARFFLPIGIVLIGVGLIKIYLKPIKSRFLRVLARICHIVLFLGIAFILTIEGLIVYSSFDKNTSKPDYIIVLGAGLWGDTPSLILQQRLETALDFTRIYPDAKIIVSGGQGDGETITEAAAMRSFLLKKGIDESKIIIEDKSRNTIENLSYSKSIINREGLNKDIKTTIITSNFHMFRAKFLARRIGLVPYGYTSPIPPYLIPVYYTRECLAVLKSAVLDVQVDAPAPDIGVQTDSYKGVPVYNNGKDYGRSYGLNYSKDGYYYGYKWQCVEYIKRFYYDVKNHKMPDGFGNAKDFFDTKLSQGEFNKARGLYQYKNGENVKPEPDDLLVFTDSTYGHVAIVTEVGKDYIEIIQQNIFETPRQKLAMEEKDGKYFVGTSRKPAGWLRKINN